MKGHFTLEALGAALEKKNFRVSRATLYNTIHLFLELRLVVRHNLVDGTKYEASSSNENHVHQVCTRMRKSYRGAGTLVQAAISETKLQRFRKDAFVLYIYGVCSACQAKITQTPQQQE